jgi:hypothetical protein
MEKKPFAIQQSNKKYGGYYRLIAPPQTESEKIKAFLLKLIRFPYGVYQTIIGRLLSYMVINPLFRKDESNESLILQHKKYPDPLFIDTDEKWIITVYPKAHILARIILNWHNFIINHVTTAKVVHSLLSKVLSWLPNGSRHIERYLDKVIDKIEEKIQEKQGKKFKLEQIHFRGIQYLNAQQQENFYRKLEQRFGYDFFKNREHLYFYTLQTTDNAKLDSLEIRPSKVEEDMTKRRFIIAHMPRSNNYIDWLKYYQIYARETKATVIVYNYRGIGLSQGLVTNQESLYSDAYEQAQRLLALGAKPENIAMLGECLGANVATHAAGTLQQEGLPVKLFNARSFRSLTSILSGRTTPEKNAPIWHPKTWFYSLIRMIVRFIVNPIIWSAGWALNVEDKFTAIPPHDRDFIVVRSNKDQHGQHFADDLMVPHKQASTYSLVKEKIKIIAQKKEKGESLSLLEQEWLQDHPKHHKFHVSEQRHTRAKKVDGHTVHPRLLTTTKVSDENPNIDGRQYTINFFNRIWQQEEVHTQMSNSI